MLRYLQNAAKAQLATVCRGFRNRGDIYGAVNPLNDADPKSPKIILEAAHITNKAEQDWVLEEFSKSIDTPLPLAQRLNALRMVTMAETFEHYLHKKFSQYKRYSGEGMESLVPCLYSICQGYHTPDPSSLVLTIAHRGKLAVLASLMNYPLRNLFWKIKGKSLIPDEVNKDVYYYPDDIATHIAVTAERSELKGLKISMLHNPSHLEIGGSVGMGKTRAKIDRGHEAMHVWVHGDAALAGQGVVYEVTQMAHLHKFRIGGTLHVVANNQIGFTANEATGRSSPYCTDLFKIIESPVVHVNALSVDDVVKMSYLSVAYRKKWGNDFVIDMVGYRKYGHNEVDDPTFTNPLMYKKIRQLNGCGTEYAQELIKEGVISQEYVDKIKSGLEDHLNKEFEKADLKHLPKDEKNWLKVDSFQSQWKGFTPIHNKNKVDSGYSKEKLEEIYKLICTVPEDIKAHSILKKNLLGRLESLKKNHVDWATAELLAMGSLLQQGFNVRLSGEDVIRGTFSQRNIGFFCQDTEKLHIPLSQLSPGKLFVVNSLLAELGVLGFEYGYAMDNPKNLVMWEAQFGDFANMAQPIIDTYIASGEAKWMRQSGLTILLPHGQEGQGPDHSSAGLEKYLNLVNDPLSTQLNIQVANLVYPANYFHLLRSSMLRDFRRPLIIGTPKSGLRNKLAVSAIEDFSENSQFKPVIVNNQGNGSKTLFVCNGKVYLDLLAHFPNISIMLIEELAPLPFDEMKENIQKIGKNVVWVQEEPINIGVYGYIRPYLEKICGEVQVVARPSLSASATGSSNDFKIQQDKLYEKISSYLN